VGSISLVVVVFLVAPCHDLSIHIDLGWDSTPGLDIIMFVRIPLATLLLMSGEVAAVVKADPTIIAHSFSLSACLQEFIIISTSPSQTPLLHLARLALVRFRT
jgi:hypothetical protein